VYLSRGIAVLLCGSRCNLDDLHPTTAGYFELSRKAQGPLFSFPAPDHSIFFGLLDRNGQSTHN
jgi:hypothetical protein